MPLGYAPLVERQSDCVTCPPNPPACPACDNGEVCQITSQSCTQCAQSLCIQASSVGNLSTSPTDPTAGPNVAAIAGGIVGALVVAGCVAGGLFWYVRKKKRATRDMDVWLDKTSNGEADDEKSMAHGSIHPVLSPDFSNLLIPFRP